MGSNNYHHQSACTLCRENPTKRFLVLLFNVTDTFWKSQLGFTQSDHSNNRYQPKTIFECLEEITMISLVGEKKCFWFNFILFIIPFICAYLFIIFFHQSIFHFKRQSSMSHWPVFFIILFLGGPGLIIVGPKLLMLGHWVKLLVHLANLYEIYILADPYEPTLYAFFFNFVKICFTNYILSL